jgi:hypothetical protein
VKLSNNIQSPYVIVTWIELGLWFEVLFHMLGAVFSLQSNIVTTNTNLTQMLTTCPSPFWKHWPALQLYLHSPYRLSLCFLICMNDYRRLYGKTV